jgi:hypothetical protein
VVEADPHYQPCLLQSAILAPLRVFRQAGRDSSVTLYGSLQNELPSLNEEKFMDTNKPDTEIEKDVLHIENQSKLSAEAIAKAVAHHEKNHKGDHKQNAAVSIDSGKKPSSGKPK